MQESSSESTPVGSGRRSTRWGAVAGITFVVLYLVGTYITLNAPGSGDTAAERTAFYADDANTIILFVAMYLVVIAGLAFLWFVASMRNRLRPAGQQLWLMAVGCALLFVAMLLVISAIEGSVAVNVLFGDNDPELGAETLRTLSLMSGLLRLVAGGLAAAVFIALVSRLGSKAAVFPTWLIITGYVAAVLVAFSFLFIPSLALQLWVLIVSVYLLARPDGAAASAV